MPQNLLPVTSTSVRSSTACAGLWQGWSVGPPATEVLEKLESSKTAYSTTSHVRSVKMLKTFLAA